MTQEKMLSAVTGPVGALALAVIVLWAMNNWIEYFSEKHFEAVEQMMASHKEDRQLYKKTIEELTAEIKICCEQKNAIAQ